MKWIKMAALAAGVLLCFSTMPVQAQGIWDACNGAGASGSEICGDETQATDLVKNIINLLLYVIGVLSVIMITHSGLKYVNSRGDAEGVKSAKNTLLYSIVGLIVAMLAFTIVNFVVGAFGSSAGNQNQQTNENE